MKQLMTAVVASVALSGCVMNVGGKVVRLGSTAKATQPPTNAPASTPKETKEANTTDRAAVPGKAAAKALDAIDTAQKTGAPVTDEAIAALEQHAKDAEAIRVGAGGYYLNTATWLRVSQALVKSDTATVATLLEGTLNTSGDGGKELSVAITAKADTCYLLVGAFRSNSGTEKVESKNVDGPASLRAFTLDLHTRQVATQGFCATVAGPHTIRITSAFGGTTNGLRYAVVEHARESLPLIVARSLNLETPDRCDADAWENALLKPIPGTIGWQDRELSLITTNLVGDTSANCAWPIDDSSRFSVGRSCWPGIARLAPKPAAGALVFAPFKLDHCPSKEAKPRGEESRKILACEAAIAKKYDSEWDEVDARRRAAESRRLVDTNAEVKAQQLRKSADKDWAAQCKPIFVKARASMEARYNKIIDAVQANPPVENIGRSQANSNLVKW